MGLCCFVSAPLTPNTACCPFQYFLNVTVNELCPLSPSLETEILNASMNDPPPPQAALQSSSQGKVNPYSVIDISPVPLQPSEQQQGPSSSTSSQMEPKEQEGGGQDLLASSPGISSGYSVPVPCGYATPSGVPLITPTYTTPVIIRHLSVDEDGKVELTAVGASKISFITTVSLNMDNNYLMLRMFLKCLHQQKLFHFHCTQIQIYKALTRIAVSATSTPCHFFSLVFPKALPQGSKH